MSSIPLYKAFIEVGASEQSATRAAEDVIQVSQLPQLATKADLAGLELATKAGLSALELATKAGLSELEMATKAGLSELELTTKADLADLKNDISNLETRLLKWVVGCGFLFAGIIIAGIGLVIQIMLMPVITR
ncbi:MAG: hypothetical protein OXI88_11370 [Gammaproteobacteria bacterium]|nr:hypothetical protein [Gammaproteobacteria bacterium]